MKVNKKATFFEFLVFGILIGIVEDVIAIKLATGESITLKTIGIIILVAIPFAFLGEIVIDNLNLNQYFKKDKN
ncbi:MAG: hypothetical protein ACQEP3_02605 [Patescibacteria group bacterium]